MKAMIFAAGMGTRLYPLTIDTPKALIEVTGKTLLQRAIEKVSSEGFKDIVINIHHHGDKIIDYLKLNGNFGLNIEISDERDHLLETGGAILKAASYLNGKDPVLIYNVDVLSNLSLNQLLEYHNESGGVATLAIRDRKTTRYLLFDENMRLGGWKNISTGEEKIVRNSLNYNSFAFSGIQIIDPSIFDLITEKGRFSLVSLYLRLAETHPIFGFNDTSGLWMDLGKPDQLREAEKVINRH